MALDSLHTDFQRNCGHMDDLSPAAHNAVREKARAGAKEASLEAMLAQAETAAMLSMPLGTGGRGAETFFLTIGLNNGVLLS